MTRARALLPVVGLCAAAGCANLTPTPQWALSGGAMGAAGGAAVGAIMGDGVQARHRHHYRHHSGNGGVLLIGSPRV